MQEPKIYFIDQSYDRPCDLGEIEASEYEKNQIEAEFNLRLQHANIGVGADLPAFLAVLGGYAPLAAAMYIFFHGKEIKENLDAWIEIGSSIAKFLSRQLHMNREASVLIALHTYTETTNETPKSIRLIAYKVFNQRFDDNGLLLDKNIVGYDENPNEEDLSDVTHILRMTIDESSYRFIIRGRSIEMNLLEELK